MSTPPPLVSVASGNGSHLVRILLCETSRFCRIDETQPVSIKAIIKIHRTLDNRRYFTLYHSLVSFKTFKFLLDLVGDKSLGAGKLLVSGVYCLLDNELVTISFPCVKLPSATGAYR